MGILFRVIWKILAILYGKEETLLNYDVGLKKTVFGDEHIDYFFYFHMEMLCPHLLSESCQYTGTIECNIWLVTTSIGTTFYINFSRFRCFCNKKCTPNLNELVIKLYQFNIETQSCSKSPYFLKKIVTFSLLNFLMICEYEFV